MAAPEKKLIKIIDKDVHTRAASVETVGAQNAIIVKQVDAPSGGVDPVGLKNSLGTTIDPATDGKLNTIHMQLMTNRTRQLSYMGVDKTSDTDYEYYGFFFDTDDWIIARKDLSDPKGWQYAQSENSFSHWVDAWASPQSETYDDARLSEAAQISTLVKQVDPIVIDEIKYEYMGKDTTSNVLFEYFGFKENGGTNWKIMRKELADGTAWKYAYGTSGFSTAWLDPSDVGITYANPPD